MDDARKDIGQQREKKSKEATWLEAWAGARAVGVDEATFWNATPHELSALVDALVDLRAQENRAATLRSGLVTAAVYNVNRRRGQRAYQARDFVWEPVKIVSPEEMKRIMDGWAAGVNRQFAERAK